MIEKFTWFSILTTKVFWIVSFVVVMCMVVGWLKKNWRGKKQAVVGDV